MPDSLGREGVIYREAFAEPEDEARKIAELIPWTQPCAANPGFEVRAPSARSTSFRWTRALT